MKDLKECLINEDFKYHKNLHYYDVEYIIARYTYTDLHGGDVEFLKDVEEIRDCIEEYWDPEDLEEGEVDNIIDKAKKLKDNECFTHVLLSDDDSFVIIAKINN